MQNSTFFLDHMRYHCNSTLAISYLSKVIWFCHFPTVTNYYSPFAVPLAFAFATKLDVTEFSLMQHTCTTRALNSKGNCEPDRLVDLKNPSFPPPQIHMDHSPKRNARSRTVPFRHCLFIGL